MAGPVSHTAFAQKALRSFLKGKDEEHFIVGNLFPDIRYLKVIDRESTHFTKVTLKEIQEEPDSFKAGMLLHSIIDEAREAFVLKHEAYSDLPDSHLSTIALKVCEDAKLYSLVQNWQPFIDYLRTVKAEEEKFNIPIEKVQEWHMMHIRFFSNPSLDTNSEFFHSLGFSKKQVSEIFGLVEKITKNRVTDNYLYEFYDNLEQLLKER